MSWSEMRSADMHLPSLSFLITLKLNPIRIRILLDSLGRTLLFLEVLINSNRFEHNLCQSSIWVPQSFLGSAIWHTSSTSLYLSQWCLVSAISSIEFTQEPLATFPSSWHLSYSSLTAKLTCDSKSWTANPCIQRSTSHHSWPSSETSMSKPTRTSFSLKETPLHFSRRSFGRRCYTNSQPDSGLSGGCLTTRPKFRSSSFHSHVWFSWRLEPAW